MTPFYSLKVKDDAAELYIYGDIASDAYKWAESDVSANDIVNKLQGLNAKTISVYINSYGGEVAQGLAIYNALKRHKAKVTTYVDGFACSIASIIAMAGDTRKMYDNSLLMIHNAWTYAVGNVNELLKQAEDLKVINDATKKAYLEVVNISDDELTAMLDAETWITAEKALEMGFITEIVEAKKPAKASANAQNIICKLLMKTTEEETNDDDENEETELKNIVTDIVARVEKLEKEVFKEEKQEEKDEEETPPEEKENDYLSKFLKSISK